MPEGLATESEQAGWSGRLGVAYAATGQQVTAPLDQGQNDFDVLRTGTQ